MDFNKSLRIVMCLDSCKVCIQGRVHQYLQPSPTLCKLMLWLKVKYPLLVCLASMVA
jgi:hypothetical protein